MRSKKTSTNPSKRVLGTAFALLLILVAWLYVMRDGKDGRATLAVQGASSPLITPDAFNGGSKTPAPSLTANEPSSIALSHPVQPAPLEALKSMPMSIQTKTQLATLDQVLHSRNDNDPRLDKDLKNLSPEAKKVFSLRYQALPQERRNERGTIVFLIGRALDSVEDAAFLKDVLAEKPCLSLSDCTAAGRDGDPHREMGVSTTLNYPQLVALHSIESWVNRHHGQPIDPSVREELLRALDNSRNSPVPAVAQKADQIWERLNR